MAIKYIYGLEDGPGMPNFMTVHMQQSSFIFSDERKYRIQRHLAFWGFWWLFQGFLYSFVPGISSFPYGLRLACSMADSFIYLVAHMFMAYSFMYFMIPRFLLKQKYWLTAFWMITITLMTCLISASLSVTVIEDVRNFFASKDRRYYMPFKPTIGNIWGALMAGLRGAITIGGMAASIKLMKYWYVKEQRNLQLQKENMDSQLQLLKAQVHPHFLFNTLNNIYSHTQGRAPVASKLVAGLSEMLRFILYEGNKSIVLLSEELKMINGYIGLEKIRYGNKLDLHIDLPEQTHNLYIAPLLLLPLVENCFKHGASNMLEQPWISLNITLEGNQMQMKLLNGKAEGEKKDEGSCGIGIGNVKQRLKLLYPGKHELMITNDEDVFIVNLKIELETRSEPLIKSKPLAQATHA